MISKRCAEYQLSIIGFVAESALGPGERNPKIPMYRVHNRRRMDVGFSDTGVVVWANPFVGGFPKGSEIPKPGVEYMMLANAQTRYTHLKYLERLPNSLGSKSQLYVIGTIVLRLTLS